MGNLTIDTPKFNIADGSTAGTYTITDNNGNVLSDKTISEILSSDFIYNNIINSVSQARSDIGTKQNILEIRSEFEANMEATKTEALSRIEDADVAKENLEMTKYQTLVSINSKLLSTYSSQMTTTLGQLLDIRI